ncbi:MULTISPECIES: HU family DNA-binding protein [Acidithiobacillus]|uniref:HU family DNA-binding protein n=1 Tax=Acidithiobacillus ferrivorans TaxID=160808 RepID=UPI001C07B85F|nr:HU family DNA-binding protein [Acidithiobacillus ferrivorans]MBU2852079.1 HU family DNA-binding protein [Acidithiobacillus ferrivorans]
MKKSELVAALAYHAESSKVEAERFLDAFGKTINAEILKAVKIVIPEVGTFQLSHREARKGRNPQTGAEIEIAARNTVTFKAAKPLQDKVNP